MEQAASVGAADLPLRILLCEDAALTVLHLKVVLAELGHQVVGQASNGEESIQLARELRPDLILMDVCMPGVCGIEALQQIMAENPTTVVMLTAYSDAKTVQRALNAGASGYLVKPFRKEQLAPTLAVARARFLELQRERLASRLVEAKAARIGKNVLRQAVDYREEFQRERGLSQTLAQNFLCPAPQIPGLEIETTYEPAHSAELVGGDYVDFIHLGDQRLGVVIADVCGKGLAAASLTAVCRHTLRAYALEDSSPDTVLPRLNRALCRKTSENCSFITLFYGVLDLETFHLTYANAGHPAPILCAPGTGEMNFLSQTGGPLGIETHWEWATCEVNFPSGSILALYTDGILEARRGREQFGTPRIEAALRDRFESNTGIAGFTESLKEEARKFAGGEFQDDVAVVVIQRMTGE